MERYCVLTLEYNGYHVKRNALSYGIEDVMAISAENTLIVQVKNSDRGRHSMTKEEQLILKKHAMEIRAIPIYLFSENKKKYWVNLLTNDHYDNVKSYTKQWYENRQKVKKGLRELNKKSKSQYNKYVLENWDFVKNYIC